MLALPSKDTPPIVLAVVSVAALPATLPVTLPVKLPVTLPSKFATKVPVVTLKFPVLAPVPVVVPIKNLSALSSQPMNALLPVEPLSKIRPRSLEFEPVLPEPSSIHASSIVVFVALFVTVEPLTVRFPETTMSLNVTLLLVETA